MDWQPIETAPVGEWVLITGPACRTSARHMVARLLIHPTREWESADDGYRVYMNPTGWMPLPAPPAAKPGE